MSVLVGCLRGRFYPSKSLEYENRPFSLFSWLSVKFTLILAKELCHGYSVFQIPKRAKICARSWQDLKKMLYFVDEN